jgi:hypothetical protein
MIKRIFGAAVMMGLVASSAVSAEAAQLTDSRDKVTSDIVVVNDYTTAVRVYVEDSEGSVHRLGRVRRGQVRQFEAPADVFERGDFRVRIRPIDPYLGSNRVNIKTRLLNVRDDEQVIMWLKTDLRETAIEVG